MATAQAGDRVPVGWGRYDLPLKAAGQPRNPSVEGGHAPTTSLTEGHRSLYCNNNFGNFTISTKNLPPPKNRNALAPLELSGILALTVPAAVGA